MKTDRITTVLGVSSIGCSLLFWLSLGLTSLASGPDWLFLPLDAYFALWIIALFLALLVLARDASRWWAIAALLPFINFTIVLTIISLSEP